MKKLLLKVAFNGKNYCGFQFQKNGITVQEKLTQTANSIFRQKCLVTGCSRTDSGVHANGFCVTVVPEASEYECDEWCRIPRDKIHTVFNIQLPPDIAVMDTAFVDAGFHPRYDVEYKEYIYKILDDERRNPFDEGFVYRLPRRIPDEAVEKMKEASLHFVGTYDFMSFMAHGSKVEDTVRTVKYAEIQRDGRLLIFRTAADGFLYNMVRIMTGTLLDVSCGKITPDDIPEIIKAKGRQRAGATVPPDGLYLSKVEYTEKIDWFFGEGD